MLPNIENQNKPKIGFWSVTSLVAGSQIGSGIFLIPSSLAVFGAIGLSSWFITAFGAVLLALVYSRLSGMVSKTGGPHTFIEAAFGNALGFFSAWTYWVISWVSTPIVIVSVVSYLSPLWGQQSPLMNLILEMIILFSITSLNLKGVNRAGRVEFVFTLLKLLPLLLVPLAGLFFIKLDHFVPFNPTNESNLQVLNAGALLTLWGFIGLESATAPAEEVKNPKKTIPLAIITGTLIVAFVYILSSFVIMGVVPTKALIASKAPFADAASIIFGGSGWFLIISVAASIVCLGTLNAWILTSGQIALGAAQDGHFPKFFKIKNKKGAPVWGLIISSLGIVPVLFLMLDLSLVDQINYIIDISVTAFLFIYVLSVLSYLKILWEKIRLGTLDILGMLIGIGAFLFCLWALYASGIKMLGFATLIPLSGLPIYLWRRRSQKIQTAILNNYPETEKVV